MNFFLILKTMSNHTKLVNVGEFSQGASLPVVEPKRKPTGNGKATFKTATEAAKAAIAARDETRSLNAAAQVNAKTAAEAQQRCLSAGRELLELADELEARNTYLTRCVVWVALGATLVNTVVHLFL